MTGFMVEWLKRHGGRSVLGAGNTSYCCKPVWSVSNLRP
ncbi:Hypothetical protein (plasmid) [Pseudomonas putida]|nr:Hypothetical protein [Pseudomonas putida]